MRILAAAVVVLCSATCADARPAHSFAGDRYLFADFASEVARSVRCAPPTICKRPAKRKQKVRPKRKPRPVVDSGVLAARHPLPVPRPAIVLSPADEEAAAERAVWSHPFDAPVRGNLFRGFARELARALPGRSLAGVVPPLAAKAQQLVGRCGSKVISAVRHTRVRGSGRISLHSYGRAVDMAGNPGCMYALLRGWPGGVSVDYARVRHIHISYSPKGREWGARFAHWKPGKRATRYAKRKHRTRYASR